MTPHPPKSPKGPPKGPPNSLRSFQDHAIVCLVVGPAPHHFFVHDLVLRRATDVLVPIAPSEEPTLARPPMRTVHLPDDDPSLVDHFVRWLYFRAQVIDVPESLDPKARDGMAQHFLDLYVFADKIHCRHLMDALIPGFRRLLCADWKPDFDFLLAVMHRTSDATVLRDLLVDWWIWSREAAWLTPDGYPDLLRKAPDLTLVFALRLLDQFYLHYPSSSEKDSFNPLKGFPAYKHRRPKPRPSPVPEDDAQMSPTVATE